MWLFSKEKGLLIIGTKGITTQGRAPVLTKYIARGIRFLRRAVLRAGFTCFGAVPLFSDDEVIGATTVARRIIQRLEQAPG